MSQLKKYLFYVLLIVGMYFFSNYMGNIFFSTNYKPFSEENINNSNYEISIYNAEHTRYGGHVEGEIRNTSADAIVDRYIKIAFISDRDNEIVTKFHKIENLKPGDSEKFRLNYEGEFVTKYDLSIVDDIESNKIHKNIEISNDAMLAMAIAGGILAVYFL